MASQFPPADSEALLFFALDARKFAPGDKVFVKLKSKREEGAATVLSKGEGETKGRWNVRFHINQYTRFVREERMTHIFQEETKDTRLVVVTSDTVDFRSLAWSQTKSTDVAIDIGCSYGKTTEILHRRCAKVIGVDVSRPLIKHCKEKFPDIDFHNFDVMEDELRFREIGQNCNVVFVDIGGNRALADLSRILPCVERCLRPHLLVVKSEELFSCIQNYTEHHPAAPTTDVQRFLTRGAKLVRDFPKFWNDALPKTLADAVNDIAADEHTADKPSEEQVETQAKKKLKRNSKSPKKKKKKDTSKSADKFASKGDQTAGDSEKLEARKFRYPLKYPWKLNTKTGLSVCRYYNFGECLKFPNCGFDHSACYFCLGNHIARDCTATVENTPV